jgi:DNA-binding response OmpR family regulator
MSGYTADVLMRHGIERDAVPYVEKPFTPDKLVGVIEAVLDAARRRTVTERSAG